MNALTNRFPLAISCCLALLLAIAGITSSLATPTKPPERVQVAWGPTESLSEVKDNPMQRGWLRPKDWMQELGDHLRKRADVVLPAGEQLQVTIDDIKLAGAFEPWRRSAAQDIRFMKDLYPPRMDLHYALTSADGTIIRQGESRLRDNAYLQRSLPTSSDPLRYDKRLIDDWLRKEFGRNSSG
jgi:hypothetical protein